MIKKLEKLIQFFKIKDKKIDDNESEVAEVFCSIRGAVIWGIIITIIVTIFFGIWAGFAQLDSAAIASGSVVLSSNRKTVQHLEGGIIEDIMVKDGDEVIIGQPLIYLNSTSANAQQKLLLGQLRSTKATESRLLAERDGGKKVIFSHPLLQNHSDPVVKEIIQSQTKLFETKQASLVSQIDILQERIMQYNEQIKGLKAQGVQVSKQIELIKEEIGTVSILLKKGFEQKPRLLALQRKEAELKSEAAKYYSEIATIKGSISETQMQIVSVQVEYLKETMLELKEVQQQISDLQEKLQASGDILERTVITAQQSGKITGLKFHTRGGVITPGTPILDIVPQDDRLIIEAQVKPQDIDVVHEGLPAKVMLSAYKSRFVPRLAGKVTQVSADRFNNENTGEAFYLARIEINDGEIEKLSTNVELYPGMPAEIFITTGEGTFLQYLASPIIDSFRRAFKEE
ncbi:HlyD family type I secretion periplasmic adaptor subunit [Rickettsiales bacterium]|nr:HlyD family type I secretion periplasmic adaptor subunit [Rickettsiales bacterium]